MTAVKSRAWYDVVIERLQLLDRRALFLLVMVCAAVVYLQFEFWKQPSIGDRANWDYMAQVIVRGGIPYRDAVNIKTPLSGYIGAAAILAGKPFGLRDLIAIRIACLLMSILIVGFTFLVANDYFKSRRIGVLAAMIILSINVLGRANSGGMQPKIPVVLFGLVSLWLVIKDRPFRAGFFGMLSALCWQPGLLFVGAAGLTMSGYLTRWRDLKWAKVTAGAALPLAAMLIYFWAAGALKDFYIWNIEFNYSVYAPEGMRTLDSFFGRLFRMLKGTFSEEIVFFFFGVIGLLFVCVKEMRLAVKDGAKKILENAPRHAIVIAPLVYFAFCAVNIQGSGDLIPLLPFIAIFSAVAFVWLLDFATSQLQRKSSRLNWSLMNKAGFAVLFAWIFFFKVADVFIYRDDGETLQQQDAEVAEIVSNLRPGDKIFAHGLSQILVLSGLPNASKYFFLDRGKDIYLDRIEPGGFSGWLERLKAERPKVVAIERLKRVWYKDLFEEWLSRDYEQRETPVFTYYVRKDEGQPSAGDVHQ